MLNMNYPKWACSLQMHMCRSYPDNEVTEWNIWDFHKAALQMIKEKQYSLGQLHNAGKAKSTRVQQ